MAAASAAMRSAWWRKADVVPALRRVQRVLHCRQQHEHVGGIDAGKHVVGQAEHGHVDSLRPKVHGYLDLTEPVRDEGEADRTRKRT